MKTDIEDLENLRDTYMAKNKEQVRGIKIFCKFDCKKNVKVIIRMVSKKHLAGSFV